MILFSQKRTRKPSIYGNVHLGHNRALVLVLTVFIEQVA